MDLKDKNTDWHDWYHKNKELLPEEFRVNFENNLNLLQFISNEYINTMNKLTPALKALMYSQYPVILSEKRPMVVEYTEQFIKSVGSKLLFKLNRVLRDQKSGIKPQEKYNRFNEWVEFYGRPQKPKLLTDEDRNSFSKNNFSHHQWESYKNTENERLLNLFTWKEKRKTEFIDTLQPILFENYKELEQLNADELILYAVIIYDEYDYYLLLCERIELFIDCGFPEEQIRISDAEFMENYIKLSPEIIAKTDALRMRRIAGEKI